MAVAGARREGGRGVGGSQPGDAAHDSVISFYCRLFGCEKTYEFDKFSLITNRKIMTPRLLDRFWSFVKMCGEEHQINRIVRESVVQSLCKFLNKSFELLEFLEGRNEIFTFGIDDNYFSI